MPTDHAAYFEAMALVQEMEAVCHRLRAQAAGIDPYGDEREKTIALYQSLEVSAREIAETYRRLARNAASGTAAFSETAHEN